MQTYVDSLQDSSLVAFAHAKKGFVCLSCHQPGVLAEVHRNVNSRVISIKESAFQKEFCLECHVGYANLIELTKDSKAFAAIANEEVNPHNSHKGEVDCYNCHKMHEQAKPIDYCYECH